MNLINILKRKWDKIKVDTKTVKQFGLILSGILSVLGAIAYFRGHHQYKWEWPLAAVSLIVSLVAPDFMKFIYRPWMMVAEVISFFVFRIILGIFFYLILSPVNIIMQLMKKDLLDQKLNRSASTYWRKRTGFSTKERYEKLF